LTSRPSAQRAGLDEVPDLRSKRAFSFPMILFSLADTGGKEMLLLVTIPAG